ncbi:glycosyltransferase family 2 protein [Rhizobium helianthi]|uniref:Glycosyltransferase family 2 protein n=1 Tax=Rhizobium helianthi TaxID=1132695 RepID=A0ABW4M5V1_9HYPH
MTWDQSVLHVDVGICTFRRPELEATLLSLFRQVVPAGVRVTLIVADNDAEPTAQALVESLRPRSPFPILYVHCPKSNISIARNACLSASKGDFLAFIDDDEIAPAQWLDELLATALATRADAVLGPVKAIYGEGAPGWMREGDFHSTRPVWVGAKIRTGYTCNVLLDMRSPHVRGRRFELSLGQSGGEDTHFFTQVTDCGGHIAFAKKAELTEPVSRKRESFTWLLKRRFRSGQTHGRILGERHSGLARIPQLGLATMKAGFCAVAAVLLVLSPIKRRSYQLRAALHMGVLSGLLGQREIRQYGSMEAA